MRRSYYIFFIAYLFCNFLTASRITLIVPIVQMESSHQISDFLYSLSTTANFHELEIFLFKNQSITIHNKDLFPYLFKYSNVLYFPLDQNYTVEQILNMGIFLSTSDYLIKGGIENRYGQYFFELLARDLDKNKKLEAVSSGIFSVRDNGRDFYKLCSYQNSQRLDLSLGDPRGFSAIMWRKSIHKVYGHFNQGTKGLSEGEFWAHVLKSKKVSKISEVLVSQLFDQNFVHKEEVQKPRRQRVRLKRR